MEKDGSFSSFFMLLLAATSLIVILSEFFAGNFNFRSLASTQVQPEEYSEEAATPETETILENSEELEYVDPESGADDADSGQNLNFEINASVSPGVEIKEETQVGY